MDVLKSRHLQSCNAHMGCANLLNLHVHYACMAESGSRTISSSDKARSLTADDGAVGDGVAAEGAHAARLALERARKAAAAR